jgi:hypothetical protein
MQESKLHVEASSHVLNYIDNLVVLSDLHSGCRSSLYPIDTEILLDEGMVYKPTAFQHELWIVWRRFHDEFVPEATRDEDYVLAINGDIVDGDHHRSKTQISKNTNDQALIAEALLWPLVNQPKCKGLLVFRGTEAHVGSSAEHEESIAKTLGALKNDKGQHSSYTGWVRLGGPDGALCHFAHHIGTTGRTHYETSAIMCEIGEMYVEAGRWGYAPADILVRSHRHRSIGVWCPSKRGFTTGLTTPAWQGKTPFSQKIPGGRQSEPQIGGVVIRQGDYDHYARPFVVGIEREKERVLCI